jgi:hypothetical protein
MSGECDKCGEHCLDCKCNSKKLVHHPCPDYIKQFFSTVEIPKYCPECKNEFVACVCMGDD